MSQKTSITDPPTRRFAVLRYRAETVILTGHDERDARLAAEWALPIEPKFTEPNGAEVRPERDACTIAVTELFTCDRCGTEDTDHFFEMIHGLRICRDMSGCMHRAGNCPCGERA